MKYRLPILALIASIALTACGGTKDLDPDFHAILDRTEQALVDVENAGLTDEAEMIAAFEVAVYEKLNAEPPVYDTPIGILFSPDTSYLGFADKNGDNIQNSGEKTMFKVEIDAENSRLVLTDETGGYHGRRFSGTGLIAGLLIGSMLGRQRASGVNSSRFNNARVNSAQPGRQASAKSRARSGGVRGGK